MNENVEKALNTFAKLLPDYFPEDLGNPNDLNRWMEVCYLSRVYDSPISEEDMISELKNRYPDFSDKCIEDAANNYMRNYSDFSLLLDYLKNKGYLVVNK